MQEVDADLGLNARLARQQSVSVVESRRCGMGCMGGGRRGKSMADFEFEALFRECKGFFSSAHRPALPESAGGSNVENNGYAVTSQVAEGTDDDSLFYRAPSHWQVLCRKLRAEARRSAWRRPVIRPYRYDSLNYAMNFDDGNRATIQQEQDGAGVAQLRYLTTQLSGPVYCE